MTLYYCDVRELTDRLTAPLSPEDQTVQSMADASPTKWHRAHTTWFFETFVLQPNVAGYRPFDEHYCYLFNSYYEAVGPRHLRSERGLITRPNTAEVGSYRKHVDEAMLSLLARGVDDPVADLIELGLHHEQQHQELILMDSLHLLSRNPTDPIYDSTSVPLAVPDLFEWRGVAGGVTHIGHDGHGFSFDNEGPRHEVFLQPFQISSSLVTNGDWMAFIEDGGYQRADLWMSEGWATVQANQWSAPLYWQRDADGFSKFSLSGRAPVEPQQPVEHASWFEATVSTPTDERHLGGHHRQRQHVGSQRKPSHVTDGAADVGDIKRGLGPQRAVSLGHTTGHALRHRRGGIADIDLPTRDAMGATVERYRLGKPGDRMFRCRVRGRVRPGRVGRDRTVVDDPATRWVLSFHESDRGLGTEKRSRQVHVNHGLPLRDGQVFERHRRRTGTRVVEQHVDATKRGLDGSKQSADRSFVDDVGRHDHRFCSGTAVADEGGRFVERVGPTSGQNHIESVAGQLERHRSPNPRTSPSHHSDAHRAIFARRIRCIGALQCSTTNRRSWCTLMQR
jgi:Sulfatase-modifying factor enzyme 1/DinB superfamily